MAYRTSNGRGDKILAREPRSEDLIPPELHNLRGPEWTGRDLNPGPQPRKGRALPPELPARVGTDLGPLLAAELAPPRGGLDHYRR